MNKNYKKGADKERRIVKHARDSGKEAFRSAGSHSSYDYVIIDWKKGLITFGQSKMGKSYNNLKDGGLNSIMKPLFEEFERLNETSKKMLWNVKFEIV